MADRYWVGGTDAWDGTAGTKWSDTSGGTGGFSVPTSADDVFFTDLSTGTCTISTGNTGAKSINCTGFTGTIAGTAAITVSGSVTLVAGMTYTYTGTLTINAASTLTSGGKTHGSITFNASGSTLTLGDACTLGTADTFTLTAGTLNLNTFTLSTGIFSSSNSNTRSITFGSANIALTSTTAATTVLSMATATNFSRTTNTDGGFTRNMAATATVSFGSSAGATSTNAINLFVNAGSQTLTISTGSRFTRLVFTGSTCSVSGGPTVDAVLTLASGGTYTSLTPTIGGGSTSCDLTSSGRELGSTTLNGVGTTLRLLDACGLGTSTFTLINGTLDLNGFTLTAGIFSSSNSNTRAITFGSQNIVLTGTTAGTTALAMATATNFTWTGTGAFARSMIGTATFQFGSTSGGTASNAPNISLVGASATLTITSGSYFKNFSAPSGTNGSTLSGSAFFAGNVTLSNTGLTTAYTGFNPTFITSGTLTSAGRTLGNVAVNGAGATLTLADALTLGTTNTFTLTQGTLALANFTLSTGIFSSSGSSTRAITFGSGNIALTSTTAATTVLSMATATNFTWTGTGGFTRNMAATATVVFGTTGGTTSNAPNLTVNAGSSALTITSGSYFKDVIFTGSTSTVTATYNACGNLTLATGGTYTSVSPTFLASGAITSSGRALNAATINGSGITVTLGDALSCSSLTVTLGTLNTTASNYAISNTATVTVQGGALSLNGSTLTTGSFSYTSGTVSAGTSLINCTLASATFAGGGQTYNNVAFTSTAITSAAVSGANTFNNLTIPARAATGISVVTFSANQIINGTFTVSAGTNATCRTTVASSVVNTSRTFTCAAVSLTDADFRDITITGAAVPASGTRIGNLKNNSGITFTSKTVYWNLAGAQNWSAAGWALLSGGAPDINNFPLAQDTAVFDDAGSVTGQITVEIAWPIGTINSLSRTAAMNFALGNGVIFVPVYGDFLIGSGVTLVSATARPTFSGRNTQSIQTDGELLWTVQLDSVGGTLILLDDLNVARNNVAFTLSNGTLNLNGKTLHQSSNNTNASVVTDIGTKNITFNGGTILIKGGFGGGFRNLQPSGFTTTAGTGLGTIRFDNASQPQFTGGGSVYNCTIDQAGVGPLTFFDGGNTVSDITNSYKATGATAIYFTAGTSNTFLNWNASGEAGRLLTVKSRTAATHTLVKTSGIVNVDYLSVSDSTATGGAAWYAGSNSTNVVNNSGWIFSSAPVFISETASASDVVAAVLTFLSSTSETATATDSFSAPNIILNPSLSETTTATDLISSVTVFSGQISENANITDVTLVAPSVFGPQVQETVAALDSIPTICTFNGQLVESATALDSVNGAFLWNLVDDSQNPNWQNIDT